MTYIKKISSVLVAVLLLSSIIAINKNHAFADNWATTTTISFSPTDNPVNAGTDVTITGAVEVTTGGPHGSVAGAPVTVGTLQIQWRQLAGVGVPCGTTGGASYATLGSDTPDVNGEETYNFETAGLAGTTIGFRVNYVDVGGSHKANGSASPCVDLVIVQTPTTTTTTFSANPAVAGNDVTITGETQGSPVTEGSLAIQQLQLVGVGVACGTPDADYVELTSDTPDVDGRVTYLFDTTGLGDQTFGFRSVYTGTGTFADSQSGCEDLDVNAPPPPPCDTDNPITIGATLASGPGSIPKNTAGAWTIEYTVNTCADVTGAVAKGGTTGNKNMVVTLADPDTGTASGASPGKSTKTLNQIITWNIGDMAADQTATLTMTYAGSFGSTGTHPLNGQWSVTYSLDGGATFQKSAYSSKVTVDVT